MTQHADKPTNEEGGVSRRTLVKGAAWSVPVIAVAIAAPAAAASTPDVGAFSIDGDCGVLGLLGVGFILTAGPTVALPVGTIITLTGTGIANIGVIDLNGALANVSVLSPTSSQITLTGAIAAGDEADFRTLLTLAVGSTLNASVTLPAGYESTGAKASGAVTGTLVFCNGS